MHTDFSVLVESNGRIVQNFGTTETPFVYDYFALHAKPSLQQAVSLCFVQKLVSKLLLDSVSFQKYEVICTPAQDYVSVWISPQKTQNLPFSTDFLEKIFQNNNMVVVADPFLLIQYVNNLLIKTSRFEQNYFIGKNIESLFFDDSQVLDELHQTLSQDQVWQGEVFFWNKYKRKVWLKCSIQKHESQLILMGVDITQNKLHEFLMIESEKRFSNIYSKMPVMLLATDANLVIQDISDFCEEVLGYNRQELISENIGDFLFDRQKQAFSSNNYLMIHNSHRSFDCFVKTKIGKWIDVILNTHLDYDQNGTLQGIFFALQDISELKNTKRQLSAQKYALDQAAIVTITDKRGVILYANERFCQISGYSQKELIGSTHSLVNSRLHGKAFFADMWQTIVKGQIWRGEVRNRKKNGDFYWVDATIVPFMDEKNRVESFLAIRFEITEQKTLQEKIEEYNTHLEHKVEQRTQEIKDANKQLLKQNLELNHKNKYITDSIQYAKRIQEAILPKTQKISYVFEHLFVLFKPKDIVSGDFYWFDKVGNTLIAAAVDCTGHGVPGALMSMIGTTLLNKIVSEDHFTSPAQILTLLNKELLKLFRDKESKDGMDIALCSYNTDLCELRFAGANNPLIFIKNNELNVVKGDKTGIGSQKQRQHIFTEYVQKIYQPTTCYIFTDGYADQFGGTEKRKLMSRNFRELLFQVHQKPLKEQKTYLDDYLETWRKTGNEKQLDDVLVIGFQLG